MARSEQSQVGVTKITATAKQAGADVLADNILAATQVSDFVATTLGPQGRDKVIVDQDEEFEKYFEVSNSASFLLKRVTFDSPAANVVANVAGAHEDRHRDGTCLTALYAGQLLHAVEPLLERGVHPTRIAEGLQQAVAIATDVVDDAAIPVVNADREVLEAVARTALYGNTAEALSEQLASWIVEAVVNAAKETADGSFTVNPDFIQTEAIRAGTLSGTEVVDGMVLKKSYAGQYQPTTIEDPTIALVTQAFARQRSIEERLVGGEDTNIDISYDATDVEDIAAFQEYELDVIADAINRLVEASVDVVLVQDRVEDDLLPYFDKAGIAVVRNARKDRMEKVATAIGATINTHLDEFSAENTGSAAELSYERIGSQDVLFFRDSAEKNAASLLVRGSTWAAGWEVERNVSSAVHAVTTALKDGAAVPGGGAAEMQIATELRDRAPAYAGRESLAIKAAAEAFEAVPEQLARNAGLKPMDTVLSLRTAHSNGEHRTGVLGSERTTGDTFDAEIVDVAAIKRSGIELATGIATTVLRIDDAITGIDEKIV